MLNHYVVHLKLILYANYTSIKKFLSISKSIIHRKYVESFERDRQRKVGQRLASKVAEN